MRKLILGSVLVVAGSLAFAGASLAAAQHQTQGQGQGRYQSQGHYVDRSGADNARAACILPWYRFFGACEEAIGPPPEGANWHDWQNRGHYHGHYHH